VSGRVSELVGCAVDYAEDAARQDAGFHRRPARPATNGATENQLVKVSLTEFFGAFRALGATSTQPHNLRTRLLRDRRQISPGLVLASGCRRFR
jgi:hypothetical protein